MEKTKLEALNRAIVLLKAAGVAYYLKCEDGTIIQEGDPLGKAATPRTRKFNYIDLYQHVLPTMQPGDVHEFFRPKDAPYTLSQMASAISGAGCNAWGAGNAISSMNKDKDCIELLRVA